MTTQTTPEPGAPTSARDVRLSVQHLGKTYGTGDKAVTVIDDLTFDVYAGEIVCIVGPSGVGKTTLLKCLAGLHPLTQGVAAIDGTPIDGPPETMALVFQEYTRSLLPWLTVDKNVLLPLKHLRIPASEKASRVAEAVEAVGLSHAHTKYPWQLSGGMQQRVAIARALAYRPEVLIMDEPFASVDAQTRFELEDLCLRIREQFGMTIVVVTHDVDEAMYLSDRVVVLGRKPARVTEVLDVPLPRERDQVTTRATAEFANTRSTVLELIRDAH